MKIELGETDRFVVTRDVSEDVEKNNAVHITCPRCGQDVTLNARSASGEEDRESHFKCRIVFELRPKGYDLVITGNG